jgi:hypothetical protein
LKRPQHKLPDGAAETASLRRKIHAAQEVLETRVTLIGLRCRFAETTHHLPFCAYSWQGNDREWIIALQMGPLSNPPEGSLSRNGLAGNSSSFVAKWRVIPDGRCPRGPAHMNRALAKVPVARLLPPTDPLGWLYAGLGDTFRGHRSSPRASLPACCAVT